MTEGQKVFVYADAFSKHKFEAVLSSFHLLQELHFLCCLPIMQPAIL